MFNRQDKELEIYRNLMKPPSVFEDGFNWKSAAGALFVGFLMLPASMYLHLFAGAGNISAAAQWVTVILFAEVARRSLKELRVQEIYILFFMSGLALSSPFEGLLWRQYLVQADPIAAMGIAQDIPSWYAPSAEQIKEHGRSFFSRIWVVPILLVSLGLVVSKIDEFGLGYVLYRITNDVERLPFPMAPVGAQGITALADSKGSKEPWRWRCFSIGGMLGLAFGLIYIGLPAITGAILTKPVVLFPIPFADFTRQTADLLPATPMALCFDLTFFIGGMVLPFWAVIGSALGVLSMLVLNPILFHWGMLPSWTPQMKALDAWYANYLDFFLSFGIGQTIAIVVIGIVQILGPVLLARRALKAGAKPGEDGLLKRLLTNNTQRGDFSIFIGLSIYAFTAGFWIILSCWLVDGFPWEFFVFYAVVYTPLISYASAKLEGMAGQAVTIPYIREATYILSGYQGVAIWFAPAPLPDYGRATVQFRVMELTGTKLMSKVKAIMITVPIIIVTSLLFSQLLWGMAEIPSSNYPYAQQYWELNAKQQGLMYTSTTEGGSQFQEAWKWDFFGWGLGTGLGAFAVLSYFGMPTLLVYGLVRGLGQNIPAYALLELGGALIGGFYFRKKFGEKWLSYTPVLAAGFACGMGLVSMVSIAINILIRMMSPLIY